MNEIASNVEQLLDINGLESFEERELKPIWDLKKFSSNKVITRDKSLYKIIPADNSLNYYKYKYITMAKFYNEYDPAHKPMKHFSMIDHKSLYTLPAIYKGNRVSVENVFTIEVLYFHRLTGTKFDCFMGVKELYMQLEQFQPTKPIIQIIKSFCVATDIRMHKSGEIAVPSDLSTYNWMKYVYFSNDYTRYTLKPKHLCSINNPLKEALYAEAEENYYKTQYVGSIQEEYDNYLKNHDTLMIQQSDKLKAEEDLSLIDELMNKPLPADSYLEIVSQQWDVWDIKTKKPVYITEILLTIGSYESLVEISGTEYFQYFVKNRATNGTQLSMSKAYHIVNTKGKYLSEDEQKKMIPKLEKCLNRISAAEDIVGNENVKKMLMFDLLDEFGGMQNSYIHMIIENYFWQNGLEDFFFQMYDAPDITVDEYFGYAADCELDMRYSA